MKGEGVLGFRLGRRARAVSLARPRMVLMMMMMTMMKMMMMMMTTMMMMKMMMTTMMMMIWHGVRCRVRAPACLPAPDKTSGQCMRAKANRACTPLPVCKG